jgi:hypothetical protein
MQTSSSIRIFMLPLFLLFSRPTPSHHFLWAYLVACIALARFVRVRLGRLARLQAGVSVVKTILAGERGLLGKHIIIPHTLLSLPYPHSTIHIHELSSSPGCSTLINAHTVFQLHFLAYDDIDARSTKWHCLPPDHPRWQSVVGSSLSTDGDVLWWM